MKLIALVAKLPSRTRYLAALNVPADVHARSSSRGLPHRPTVLRRDALGDVAEQGPSMARPNEMRRTHQRRPGERA